ncbi:MAG: hypothetical protein ACXWQO_05425 [Bdellovibrionota bacterium]
MPNTPDSKHKTLVSAWAEKNTKGLNAEQLVRLFSAAIRAVEQRCLTTLSSITVMVVLDRALEESKETYAFLSDITVETQGLDLGGLLGKCKNYKLEELREGLQDLLIGLLTVIGNITADILTAPLHKQLLEINCENALQPSDTQNLHLVKPKKSNRDES